MHGYNAGSLRRETGNSALVIRQKAISGNMALLVQAIIEVDMKRYHNRCFAHIEKYEGYAEAGILLLVLRRIRSSYISMAIGDHADSNV